MPLRLVPGLPPPPRASQGPTSRKDARERERPGSHPVFQNIGAHNAEQIVAARSVPRCWTDSRTGRLLCAFSCGVSAIASVSVVGAGDGLQPPHTESAMSYRTIAATLALRDVSVAERLAAFALASYADAEHQTFAGNPAAATRAGLGRTQYLAARDRLVARGLLTVVVEGGGRGRPSTLTLEFGRTGPWREEPINPQLFEAVLGHSRARGPARVLLATLAALANEHREVVGLTTDEIRSAAGLSDRTYRRARSSLLAAGELVVEDCVGGRGNTCRWRLEDPATVGPPLAARKRVTRAGNARPLVALTRPSASANPGQVRTLSAGNPGHDRTLSAGNPGQDRTLSAGNPGQDRTLSAGNPGHDRTLSAGNPGHDRTLSAGNPGHDRTLSAGNPGHDRTLSAGNWKAPGSVDT